MSVRDTSFRLTREVNTEEIDWPSVSEAVGRRCVLSAESAERRIDSFLKRLRNPLDLSWFRQKNLSEDEVQIALALCEQYGADRVILQSDRSLFSGAFHSQLSQQITLSPIAADDKTTGCCHSKTEVSLPFFQIRAHSIQSALLAHLILFVLGVVSFVVIGFCLLYCLAVFVLFVLQPAEVTIAALNNLHIGLALLVFLVLIAGVFGRGVKRLLQRMGRTA